MDAKAAVLGLTLGCDRNHIIRAALESIPYQIKDVIVAMEQDSGIKLQQLQVDGGITVNRFVMHFLADLLQTDVVTIGTPDVSALGAACLAGLQRGTFSNIGQLEQLRIDKQAYSPGPGAETAQIAYEGWKRAVQQLVTSPR